MTEGIDLPNIPRGTLLPEGERIARADAAAPQILAALDGELDAVAIEATLACLLWETFVQTNWCGFYRHTGAHLLTVGPYIGTMGCLRIEFERGVCGACARTGEVQLVDDVHAFPGHIACDMRTQSEVVLPVRDADGTLRAVFDLDSTHPAGFSRSEADRIAAILSATLGRPGVRF
jgi:GAF domain-containing protein